MSDDSEALEITTFQSRESYVYAPLPPVSSLGHRAEFWNVDKWFKAVRLTVVKSGDDLVIRLLDQETGELFAECPVPNDIPISTTVEPVTDSSRYFALKVVDRATKNHAFIGIGFRERSEATDFCAALDDHRQYLRRQREAEVMKEEFEQKEAEQGPSQDMALKGSIKLNLSNSLKKRSSATESSFLQKLTAPDAAGLLKLPPPPGSSGGAQDMAATMRASLSGSDQLTAAVAQVQLGSDADAQAGGASQPKAAPDDDDWGDFVA